MRSGSSQVRGVRRSHCLFDLSSIVYVLKDVECLAKYNGNVPSRTGCLSSRFKGKTKNSEINIPFYIFKILSKILMLYKNDKYKLFTLENCPDIRVCGVYISKK